jgi:hypothetical protein
VLATYTYQSKQHTDQIGPYADIPGYGLFNLSLNWGAIAGGPVNAGIFVTNVAVEFYPLKYADFTPMRRNRPGNSPCILCVACAARLSMLVKPL